VGGSLSGERINWAGFKLLVYVTEWHRFLSRRSEGYGCAVLDQGPIYALVRLKAEAKGARGASFERWWNEMIEFWATELDVIVWLDAQDHVVRDRINTRVQRHTTKGRSPDVVQRFTIRYRHLFEEVLDRVANLNGARILHFDTGETNGDRIAAHIRPLLTAGRDRDGD
jgi:hypothetical protein